MDNVEELDIRDSRAGALIAVRVVPGSSADRICGVLGGALKLTTAAPAERGRANAAVARLLARALGVKVGAVQLTAGRTSRHKQFRVAETPAGKIRSLLAQL